MIEFLKSKWYWVAGGLVGVWIFSKLMSTNTSANAPATTANGSDPYAAYSSPAVIANTTNADASLQIAQIQANTAIANNQVAAAAAYQQAQLAEHATESTNASNVAISQSKDRASMTINGQNVQLGELQSNNALLLGTITSNNALALGKDTNAAQLAAIKDSDASKVAAIGIQGNVALQQIASYTAIAQSQIDASKTVQMGLTAAALQSQQMAEQAQQRQLNTAQSLIMSGQLNKGGTGGVNQLAAWNSAVNPSSAASGNVSAAQVATEQAAANASMISSIVGSIASVITGSSSSSKAGGTQTGLGLLLG